VALTATLLRQQVSLWAGTITGNGAGGGHKTWASYATVAGRYYVRQLRSSGKEPMEAGQPVDPSIVDFVLDAAVHAPSTNDALKAEAEARWFGIISVQVQDRLAFVRAREVAPLA
jgi:hypothetical protein